MAGMAKLKARLDSARTGELPDIETERAIVARIFKTARDVDDQNYAAWMDAFTSDGVYAAITYENFVETGLYLFKDSGRRALQERVAFLNGLWQTPRAKTLHLIGNFEFSAHGASEVFVMSNFIMSRTGDSTHCQLHAAGRYYDTFVLEEGAWLLKERVVVVDSNLLPGAFTDLL